MLARITPILLAISLPTAALADPLDCYRAGNAAMKAGDFAAAAEHYATARAEAECAPAIDGLLFNEAVALERLADDTDAADDDTPACRALAAWREASADARDATRDAITDAIGRLETKCPPPGSLAISCAPAGGTVLLPMLSGPRACPTRYPEVRPGRYAGEVVAAGRAVPFEIDVVSGQLTEHRIRLDAPPPVIDAPVEVPPAVGAAAERGPDLAIYGWSAVGLGVISGGLAAWAWSEGYAAAEAAEGLQPGDGARYDGLADEHEQWGMLYAGGLIGAGLLLATGATLLLFDDDAPVEAVVGPVSGVVVRWGP